MKYKTMMMGAAFSLLLAGTSIADEYPTMELKYAHAFPASFHQSTIDQWWVDEVERRSGGKIKIQIAWSGALGKATEILRLVGAGAVDLGSTSQNYFPSELPLLSATGSLPMVFETNKQGQIITTEIARNFPAVMDELKKNNVYPLYFHSLNPYHLLCNKPVRTMADFKGLRIRSWGEYIPQLWSSLGAIPVNAMVPEVYEGLQRGQLDCSYYSWDLQQATKMYEVAKYAISINFGALGTFPIWVNWETWHNEWPESVKTLFEQVSAEAAQRDITQVSSTGDKALTEMMAAGVELVEFQDEEMLQKAVPDFMTVWIDTVEKVGLGEDAREISKYWQQRITEIH